MPHPPFLSQRTLSFSPEIAETIGLEAAVMLSVLQQWAWSHPPAKSGWRKIDLRQLEKAVSFWPPAEMQKQLEELEKIGVIEHNKSAPSSRSDYLQFRFADEQISPVNGKENRVPAPVSPQRTTGRRPITQSWQPSSMVYAELEKNHGIEQQFAESLVDAFMIYWQDRGDGKFSWDNCFRYHVIHQWQQKQGSGDRKITPEWYPEPHTIEELTHPRNGVALDFIEDCIGEFISYWMENNSRSGSWNAKFLKHVKQQWKRFQFFENSGKLDEIESDWTPSPEVYRVLSMANIDTDFARERIPEFILYWRETGEARVSWNSCFLRHVKREWAAHNKLLADRADFVTTHTDNSWRYGS